MRARKNHREMKNAWLRMRQISSGFVGFHDDDSGKTAQFVFDENPKLDLLLSVMGEISDKAIIFYEYTWSGLKIVEELKKLGIGALHLYGKTKDQPAVRRRFADDPDVLALVMQNSFGVGLNLQAAKYGLFYEAPVSPIVRRQCQGRFIRQHSEHKTVFQYDFVCRGTADESVLEMLKEGRDLFRAIIDGETVI
jgi:SNF2 family DNA or RNA helicase